MHGNNVLHERRRGERGVNGGRRCYKQMPEEGEEGLKVGGLIYSAEGSSSSPPRLVGRR